MRVSAFVLTARRSLPFLQVSTHRIVCSRSCSLSVIIVVQIPKEAVLSVKSSSVSSAVVASPVGHEAQLSLALALYIELYVISSPCELRL